MADDALDEIMQVLRAEYLADAPAKLREFGALIDALAAGDRTAVDGLHRLTHQLTGSAGSYGFTEVSRLARTAEQLTKAHPAVDAALVATLRDTLTQITSLLVPPVT